MTTAHHRTRNLFSAAISCLAVVASGCSTIGTGETSVSDLPGKGPDAWTGLQQPAGESITTEIRPAGKEPELGNMPLVGIVRIQEALDQIGATKRFRRVNVRLMRDARGARQKLDIKCDQTNGRVEPHYDYVLHPGDHLVVSEDSTTALDDMLQSITGAIGMAPRH